MQILGSMSSRLVEVNSRIKGSVDHRRSKIEHLYSALGFGQLECLKIGAIYRLEGELSCEEIERISKEILCDSVTDSYSIDSPLPDNKTFFVDIWYKKGVTDSVGISLLKAVKDIGIQHLSGASHGERILFHRAGENNGEALEKKVIRFVSENLLNPLVQECKITGQFSQ